jgi:hypothetical protein
MNPPQPPKKPHHERIVAEVRPDGVHVVHDNGAKHVIPLARYLRWCLAELRRAT